MSSELGFHSFLCPDGGSEAEDGVENEWESKSERTETK